MTLLTVVRDATDMLMQPRNAAVFGGSDPEARLFTVLLKQTGQELIDAHDWSDLQGVETFTCGADEEQTDQPVSGFRRLQSQTKMWNNTRDDPIIGPTTSQEWSEIIVRVTQTYPQRWRIINGTLNILNPTEGDEIRYEYLHSNWIIHADESGASSEFSGDGDTFIFDEWMLTLGLVWRWRKAKGFDYAEEMIDYQRYVEKMIRNDRGGQALIQTDRGPKMPNRNMWYGSVTEFSG